MGDNAARILRWFAVLPGAVLAAWIAWILVAVVGRAFSGFQTESFLEKAYYITLGHLLLGAAFVYSGARIAPANQKRTAYVLAAVGLVALGFMLFPAIWVANAWSIWGGLCAVVGICAAAYSIHEG